MKEFGLVNDSNVLVDIVVAESSSDIDTLNEVIDLTTVEISPSIGQSYNKSNNYFYWTEKPDGDEYDWTFNANNGEWERPTPMPALTDTVFWYSWNSLDKQWEPFNMGDYISNNDGLYDNKPVPRDGKIYHREGTVPLKNLNVETLKSEGKTYQKPDGTLGIATAFQDSYWDWAEVEYYKDEDNIIQHRLV